MNYYLNMFTKKYADFQGRASRKEYWMIVLCSVVIGIIFAGLMFLSANYFESLSAILDVIYYVYCIAIFIPMLALSIRRLHDIGKPGVWYLINFIPLVGAIWYLVLSCKKGDSGANNFGEEPQD